MASPPATARCPQRPGRNREQQALYAGIGKSSFKLKLRNPNPNPELLEWITVFESISFTHFSEKVTLQARPELLRDGHSACNLLRDGYSMGAVL